MEQTKRLHILYDDYSINPKKTIQSFIGNDAEIMEYKENSIVSDGYIIVDVKYKVLDLDPTKIYFIKFKDCKKINMKRDNCYICKIDDICVCINLRQQIKDENTYIPISINPVIPTNREQLLYKYYGQIIDSPYHYCNTQSFSYTHDNITLKECDKCNKDTVLFNDEQISKSYGEVLMSAPYNARAMYVDSSNIKRINSLDEMKEDKSYIIDIRKITNIDKYTGIISAVKYRKYPWDVIFLNIPNYKLTQKKYNNLLSFMYNDYLNFTKWIELI